MVTLARGAPREILRWAEQVGWLSLWTHGSKLPVILTHNLEVGTSGIFGLSGPRGSCLGDGLALYVSVALGCSRRLGLLPSLAWDFPAQKKLRDSWPGTASPASLYLLPPRGAPCVHWVVLGCFLADEWEAGGS